MIERTKKNIRQGPLRRAAAPAASAPLSGAGVAPPPHLAADIMPNPEVLVAISHAYQACVGGFERFTGRNLTQWRILYILACVGSCSQKYVVEITRIDAGAISRAAQALEAEKLIERAIDAADNRLRIVKLTAAGRRVVAEVLDRRKRFLATMLEGIAPRDLKVLEKVLARIETNIETAG